MEFCCNRVTSAVESMQTLRCLSESAYIRNLGHKNAFLFVIRGVILAVNAKMDTWGILTKSAFPLSIAPRIVIQILAAWEQSVYRKKVEFITSVG